MNKEAHAILEKMQKLRPQVGWKAPESQVEIIIEFASLLVLLSDDSSKSAAKMERFTFWLILLTVVLIVIGVGQVALMLCGHQ
jgi:hypothetical protein